MPRKKLFRNAVFPYHVVNRSNDKKDFPVDLKTCWKIFESYLTEYSRKHKASVHGFVLMPNHFHLLITTPLENIDHFMRDLQTNVSKRISWLAGGNGHRFESRYKWSLVNREEYYKNCIRYIYQNPVRANLVCGVEAYRFSTYAEATNKNCEMPLITESIFRFEKKEHSVDWQEFVNKTIPIESLRVLQGALRRSEFEISLRRLGTAELRKEILVELGLTRSFTNGARHF